MHEKRRNTRRQVDKTIGLLEFIVNNMWVSPRRLSLLPIFNISNVSFSPNKQTWKGNYDIQMIRRASILLPCLLPDR